MGQKTTISQSIDVAAQKAAYDAVCKRILAEKIILAWIMKHSMREYADYEVKEIAEKCIEGKPQVSETAVLPDETYAPKIGGVGVEDSTWAEGTVIYDIRFSAIVPKKDEHIEMIINVEAQNDFYPGYPLTKRGIFYCGRMISSQYGTVFVNSHYEKIQKVYSIWICMNPPKSRANSITEYSFTERNFVGKVQEKRQNYDLMTLIMICLGDSDNNAENEMLELLDVLLSSDKKVDEKKQILEKRFNIPMTEEFEEEVESMCNLSDGVEQKGLEKGIKEGVIKTLIALVQDNLLPLEEAARRAEMTVEEFQAMMNTQNA